MLYIRTYTVFENCVFVKSFTLTLLSINKKTISKKSVCNMYRVAYILAITRCFSDPIPTVSARL